MAGKNESYWIPLADLMTVLMVIFLFMAISYMVVIKNKQKDKDSIIKDFQASRVELLQELRFEFNEDFKASKWNAVLDSNNLSIRFVNERILFDYNKSELKEDFKVILNDFLPRYLHIILKEKYADKIAEVRIEGHTSAEGDYIYNLQLSQDRTRNVMRFLLSSEFFETIRKEDKERLLYLLTANGLSFGRQLDKAGKEIYKFGDNADPVACRRVEFRIVTASDELIKRAVKKLSN
jgi:outer membrane protein OmpA-like peptidoglycan-associated protein